MGREIRKVIPNWNHPKKENTDSFQPMYDQTATDDFNEWLSEYEKFKSGEFEEVAKEHGYDINDPYSAFCDWHGGVIDAEYCRPHWNEDATWFQVYETVSEGTPVTPPFETQDQLIEYLVKNGDFWDQKRREDGRSHFMNCDPWSKQRAENFVKGPGWAPSMVMGPDGMKSGVEFMAALDTNNDNN